MTTEMIKTDCKACQAHLPDLLLDEAYASAHPELALHMESCSTCGTELNELRATFALLDEFAAPEPTTYFDTRLHARLREAQQAQPEGFWERIRSFVTFSTGRSFQPAMAGALALVLVIGGGSTFLQVRGGSVNPVTPVATSSATVNDLKVLDNNDQAEQQMGQLLDVSGSEDEDGPPAS